MLDTGLNGRTLQAALSEQPSLSLNFYSFGITLRKQEGDRVTEYPIDPAQVAVALAARVTFDTGLLTGDTLLVRQEGISKTVVEYRRPQITGIFLDDAESALRVPLPGLVMIRKTGGQSAVSYTVYAVKRRPVSLNTALFHAPLPNVFSGGSICWDSAARVRRGIGGRIAGGRLGRPAGFVLWKSCGQRQIPFP